jgi:oligopeptide/dipeptide ABC transporter ATP-binding protein
VAESGPTAELLAAPAHPYTRALRSAVPEIVASARSTRIVLHGEPPDATNPPSGCVFHPRCPLAIHRCVVEVPSLRAIAQGRLVACHRAEEVLAGIEMPERPGAVESGTAESGTVQSGTVRSGTVQPGTAESGTVESGTMQSDAGSSDVELSGAEQSATVEPGAAQPAPRPKG